MVQQKRERERESSQPNWLGVSLFRCIELGFTRFRLRGCRAIIFG